MTDASSWGIVPGYHDVLGAWHDAGEASVQAILRSMGAETVDPPPGPALQILREGETLHLAGAWDLHTDDGGEARVGGSVEHLPLGYHTLYSDDGRSLRVIVTPGRCHLPDDLRIWGWAVQLYALRSMESWGIGDLGDLRAFGEWSRARGAGVVLLNPLHASTPVPPLQPSPYTPSSRCFRSPLYLRVEEVPGAATAGVDLVRLATAGRALDDDRRIDRDEVFRLKLEALEAIYETARDDDGLDRFLDASDDTLRRFAEYCAIAEVHGPSWMEWPPDLRRPGTFAVREFVQGHARRVRFHAWMQWQLDRQLDAAGGAIGLMQDLAIGVDRGGADAWMWQDVLALDMSVGAPPDDFNRNGQDWGLPPFDPWKLRNAGYEPFIQTVRAGLRHAGGLRFDHVMGLFRLYWIPQGSTGRDGVYVRYPAGDLLDILALESVRAGAYVVGEDLGTVEPEVREELARRGVMSYRLAWFEPSPPRHFPRQSLAAITTHDLPTIAGLWTGADLEAQRDRGMQPNEEATAGLHDKLRDLAGVADDSSPDDVIVRLHERLAEAPSMIVTATLEDALGVEERPNYPGTVGGTNWSLALPRTLEELERDPGVAAIVDVMSRR
ncbi:MAG TPA: 4-alpha-glucanotransferase [Acidimicrobiales bacterium]|nr:4-alpha-glucanotransferase [Acidimicrobiales bacterium]